MLDSSERWEDLAIGFACGLVVGVLLALVLFVWQLPIVLAPLLIGTVGVFVVSLGVALTLKAGDWIVGRFRRS